MAYDVKRYDKTVNYLYSLQKFGIKLGLANIKKLMSLLGEPHRTFHSIHVAGTNGKGSTATILSSILTANGFNVGLFTSPHLVSFTERIRINGQQIGESDVVDQASKIQSLIASTDINPTFFEFVTALAFYYFASRNIDWAIVETGMGGRLDATNVIHPEITIITNISHDHCEFLGNTISDITFEKAGIIKKNIPVVTASRLPDVISHLKEIAESRNADIHIYNENFRGTLLHMDDKHIRLDYAGYEEYKNLKMPITGNYQLYNACTAIRACEILIQKGFPTSTVSIRTGMQNARLEGRLEWVSQAPPIMIDGAHNPYAARSLADSIRRLFPDRTIILVAGIMNDKDIGGVLHPLTHIASSVILTKAKYERAATPERMKEIMRIIQSSDANRLSGSIVTTASIAEALNLAQSLYRRNNIILVTGSFYTTGEVKELLGCTSVLPDLREYT